MCVLKIFSNSSSFKEFANSSTLPVDSVHDKGEYRIKLQKEKYGNFGLLLDVSTAEWDEFPVQVDDAINFLIQYSAELSSLFSEYKIDDAYLNFPLYSRLNENIVNQNDHLPRKLISLAGKLNIGIVMAVYST